MLAQFEIEKDYEYIDTLINRREKGKNEGRAVVGAGRSIADVVRESRSSSLGRNRTDGNDEGGRGREASASGMDVGQRAQRYGSDAVVREVFQGREGLQRDIKS